MAELTAHELPPPDDRGSLDVRTRALQHIVEHAALATTGTVRHHSTLGRIVGSGSSPKATITMDGHRARVSVDVAVVWPSPVATVAGDVRERVLHEAARLSGVHIRSVDVTVHVVDPEKVDQPESRRVQ